MAGEKSKSSGEYGEKIVTVLLDKIGWVNCLPGKDIPCVMGDVHKGEGGNPRKKHGVDFVVKYSDPLMSSTEHHILISVKHREDYPKGSAGRTSKFKEFLKDIAEATECYPAYKVDLQRISGTNQENTSNVIFWISESADEVRASVISDISNFRNSDNVNYKTVYLVDNEKLAFLYNSIQFVERLNKSFYFYYPDTGFNMDIITRKHQGHILPVQYINSPILLFKIVEDTGDCLVITVNEFLSESSLHRLIQLARLLTEGWAAKIVIAFSDYHDYKNSDIVATILGELQDSEFKKKIHIQSLGAYDFRNLGGNLNG